MNFHLVVAAVLVAFTILLFIQDWRTTIIASLAIPASIVTTFAFMYWMGYTLNNMTMLGLILAIGIVIDDAVVINENIFRHMEEHGCSARKAASSATQGDRPGRVGHHPVAAGDLHPGGVHGRPGGPVLQQLRGHGGLRDPDELVRLLHHDAHALLPVPEVESGSTASSKENLVWRAIDGCYGWILGWSLRHRWVIVLTTASPVRAPPFYLFRIVGFDFIPRDDQSEFEVAITLPEGYTLVAGRQAVRARSKAGWPSSRVSRTCSARSATRPAASPAARAT